MLINLRTRSNGTLTSRNANCWSKRKKNRPTGPLLVADGTVYASTQGHFYALSVHTGEVIWRQTATEPQPVTDDAHPRVPSFVGPPGVADGLVIVGNKNQIVRAFDAATGDERWRFDGATASILEAPTILGKTVYVTTQTELFALNLHDGSLKWSITEDMSSVRSPVTDGQTLYISKGPAWESLSLVALDVEARYLAGQFRGDSSASSNLGPRYVYAPMQQLLAIGRQSGEIAWRMKSDGIYNTPVVTPEAIFAADLETLYAIGPR
ncbi:MAG: PQQ-binding-like beta-propeller repeat protein [Natrialbaceae archaeon]|nr:PQQ-binding-like beta-propeller repeat protein [Natrialbaceae archaeon]